MKKLPEKVRKRDGTSVSFDEKKIFRAIQRAALEVLTDEKKSEEIAHIAKKGVLAKILSAFPDENPSVEDIQDIVEEVLMETGYRSIARSYILYRQEHQDIRRVKVIYGVRDDLKLPLNTLLILKKRYLQKDENQNVTESPKELFERVALAVSQAESDFQSKLSEKEVAEKFFQMMNRLEFIPNSPTLMNAGTSLGQLSACFVLPVEDSIDGIFESLKNMAQIHQTGGGTGFDFSQLRPMGDLVSTTKGSASGPMSFMSIFNQATGVIVQGGRRRGANMGILRCDHPDIEDFIEAKIQEGSFSNFNLSVGITDKFMDAVHSHTDFDLLNPRNKRKVRTIKARALFDLMVYSSWRTGDPGMIFLDEINRRNPIPRLGRIEATNPCGEIPLLPYESCNLGSIDLSKYVKNGALEWERLKKTIWWGVRFLDDVIQVNNYPLDQIKKIASENRKIGLGVMGFADMLIRMGIPYAGDEAVKVSSEVMKFFHQASIEASVDLAKERGVFPNHARSVFSKKNILLRNATVNTVAPTGTISIIAGCSSGIEPLFALSYVRNVLSGTRFFEIHPMFEMELRRRGLYSKEMIAEVGRVGSLQNILSIPDDLKRVFITSFDVPAAQHLRIQAAFQKHTDNSVSKTINLPSDATVEDVRRIFMEAHELRCKGITIYRYNTKKGQVLSFDSRSMGEREEDMNFIMAASEYSGGCHSGLCAF
jgi:ribonucleoside-diphosphate reductase alpha chain